MPWIRDLKRLLWHICRLNDKQPYRELKNDKNSDILLERLTNSPQERALSVARSGHESRGSFRRCKRKEPTKHLSCPNRPQSLHPRPGTSGGALQGGSLIASVAQSFQQAPVPGHPVGHPVGDPVRCVTLEIWEIPTSGSTTSPCSPNPRGSN